MQDRQDKWTKRVVLAVLALGGWTAVAADAGVQLRLHVPPATTHVIGDTISLQFHFENTTPNPLAFMWEGCCRFNGKLTVTQAGAIVPPTPPGQALAHLFAKAERLDPGVPRKFETRLSDWVILSNSGTYELRGHYQGVLPFQNPQVPRGLELWRGTADSPPLNVAVISVADYLAQREDHVKARGLALDLTGPLRLPPLAPAPLKLKVTNRSAEPRVLVWPEDVQLWIVNAAGARVLAETDIDAPREELTLAPGQAVERAIPFDSRRLEGEPWGDYRVFVELTATPDGRPRAPSNALPLRWELTRADVADLVIAAAAGPPAGLRNAPLKLLRVYVGEIVPALDTIPLSALTPEAARLASQLRIAGCLKPAQPSPGLFGLGARVPAQGPWRFNAPDVVACLGGEGPGAKLHLASLLAVRRHLGWEIALTLRPDDTATLLAVRVALADFAGFQSELANEPRAVIALSSNRVSTIGFPATIPPANLVVRLTGDALEVARRLTDSRNPAHDLIAPEAIELQPFTAVADDAALTALLTDGRLGAPRVVVLTNGQITWRQLLTRLDALLQRSLALDVIVR